MTLSHAASPEIKPIHDGLLTFLSNAVFCNGSPKPKKTTEYYSTFIRSCSQRGFKKVFSSKSEKGGINLLFSENENEVPPEGFKADHQLDVNEELHFVSSSYETES